MGTEASASDVKPRSIYTCSVASHNEQTAKAANQSPKTKQPRRPTNRFPTLRPRGAARLGSTRTAAVRRAGERVEEPAEDQPVLRIDRRRGAHRVVVVARDKQLEDRPELPLVDDGVERPASLLLALLQAVAPADVAFIAPARATWHH